MTDKTDSKEREDFKRWAEGQPWIKDCAPAAHGRKETFGHWDTEKAWLAYQAGRAFLAANAGTNCERCGGSGEDPEGFYDQSRGDAGHTHDGPCRACDGSGVAASAGSEPVESNRPSLESVFRGLSDRAYCNYIEQMRRNECLGWEHKVKHGTFGEAELKAHTLAGRLLGRHHAFAEAANALRGSDAPLTHPSPPEGMVGGWMKGVEAAAALESLAASAGSEPVARVNDDGFIVEIGDLPIAPGQKLYLHPSPPEGMVMVPKVPTMAMRIAAKTADMDHTNLSDWMVSDWPEFNRIWDAMLKAAPPTSSADSRKGE